MSRTELDELLAGLQGLVFVEHEFRPARRCLWLRFKEPDTHPAIGYSREVQMTLVPDGLLFKSYRPGTSESVDADWPVE